MTQDTERQFYRGVKCLYCKEPIPISPLVNALEFELRDNEITQPRQLRCRVFNLRCLACGKEKPYMIGEILKFEGTPVTIAPGTEPASAYLRQLRNRSRAANA